MKITSNILNPNSKFRRKMNQFDLAGDFNTGSRRLYSLIDTFHEEYILNKDRVPKLQWEYLKDDVRYIDAKMDSLSILMGEGDNMDRLKEYWLDIKNIL